MEQYKEYPVTTVGALIFNNNGECLLVKTHKWKDKYAIPGGKIERGETCIHALERELMEETGLKVTDIDFILYQDCIFSEEFYKKSHFILLNYSCKTEDTKVILNDEAESYCWVTPQKALEMDLNTPTRVLIETFLK